MNWSPIQYIPMRPKDLTSMVIDNPDLLGSCVCHRDSFGPMLRTAVKSAQTSQILNWCNESQHAERGVDITFEQAWWLSAHTHVSSIIAPNLIGEMTRPHSRIRNFNDLIGSKLLICVPDCNQDVRYNTANDMRTFSEAKIRYPYKELIYSWYRAAKWCTRIFGEARFEQWFNDEDANVCGGTWFEFYKENLRKHHETHNDSDAEWARVEGIGLNVVTPGWLSIYNLMWKYKLGVHLI